MPPKSVASVVSVVSVSARVSMASSPAEVWPLITDTDRTNRLLVGKAATYRAIDGGTRSNARFLASMKVGGFSMSYEESPFEWTLNKSFSVYRKMLSGPLRAYTFAVSLEPLASGGTDATVRIELEPRHWLLRPVIEVQARRILKGMSTLATQIDAHLRDNAPSPYEQPASPPNEERLATAEKALAKRGLDASVIALLLRLLRTSSDADLVRMRPFELAQEHGVDPRETLRTMLHAVTLGVVELRWALVCPSCRTASDQVSSLAEITEQGHCHLCDISFGIELDRAVEATFRPHPSIREVTDAMFCIGGPRRTPHVIVQANVDARARRVVATPTEEGRYRLFGRGGAIASLEIGTGGAVDGSATLHDASVVPSELHLAPGARLTVENASDEPLHVKIEKLGYASFAATAHIVMTMSEFRRLFSKDLLKPSTPLKVGHCAILFSDLTGSTALYTKAGDAAAFRFVDDHFDVLRRCIDKAGGTVVKTMGDAIMAAFLEPETCMRAAVECLRGFETFRKSHPNGADTGLKLGLFAGPVYVVTANDTIDYFGQTVNCASRVQHVADSGEITVEQSVYEALPAAMRAELRVVEHLEARVKGVDAPLRLVRTRLLESQTALRVLAAS